MRFDYQQIINLKISKKRKNSLKILELEFYNLKHEINVIEQFYTKRFHHVSLYKIVGKKQIFINLYRSQDEITKYSLSSFFLANKIKIKDELLDLIIRNTNLNK